MAHPAPRPVTLLTGASSGIGAELARVFAANGHDLVLVARREPQLQALADAIAATGAKRPSVVPADLTAHDAGNLIAERLRALDVEPQFVVNNAGFGLLGPAVSLDRERQLDMIDLNARALTDLSLRFMESVERHRGGILNVASVLGFLPGPGMAVYHATKAYVVSFSEALHQEMAGRGVRVTVACPGPVDTEFVVRPEGRLSRKLTRSADRVAREAYEGLMKGERVVITGSDNRLLSLLPRLLPRRLTLSIIAASKRKLYAGDGSGGR